MNPDNEPSLEERVFRAHVEQGSFQSGAERCWWRLISINWPHAVISIAAALREKAPKEFAFRFELSGYPNALPTAQPWDTEAAAPLPHGKWPTGGARITAVFNPAWNHGQALYLPCDRLAIKDHTAWVTQYPELIWVPEDNITKYLKAVHELLNSESYTGIRSP